MIRCSSKQRWAEFKWRKTLVDPQSSIKLLKLFTKNYTVLGLLSQSMNLLKEERGMNASYDFFFWLKKIFPSSERYTSTRS